MTEKAHMYELMGCLVISEAEGAKLGSVSDIFIDIDQNKISGLCFKPHKLGKQEYYVYVQDIIKIGRDIIFINREDAVHSYAKSSNPTGSQHASLTDLLGHWVTTSEGKQLGKLTDLDIQDEDWSVCEMWLDQSKKMPVSPREIKIGPDQIIVPPTYTDKIVVSENLKDGLMVRLLGSHLIQSLIHKVKDKVENHDDEG